MSKLNRREFKALLTEWRSNFINERGPIRDFYKKEIPASLCPVNANELIKLSDFVTDLIDFSKSREDLYTDSYESLEHKYSEFNFSVPKDSNTLSAMLNFTKNVKIKAFIGSALSEVKSGNKDPVVFFKNLGDFKSEEKIENQKTSPYITHDLEHAVFQSDIYDSSDADRDLAMFSKEDVRSNAWEIDKDHPVNKQDFYNKTGNISYFIDGDIKKLNKIANKENIVGFSTSEEESNAIKIELAFKDFFNDINYAPGIEVGDIMPSVWAYCVSNMKDKHDLDEVKKSNISDEYKKIICYILENSHDNCMRTLNNFLQSQNDRIVFINTWG